MYTDIFFISVYVSVCCKYLAGNTLFLYVYMCVTNKWQHTGFSVNSMSSPSSWLKGIGQLSSTKAVPATVSSSVNVYLAA